MASRPSSSEEMQFRHWLVHWLNAPGDDDVQNLVYGYALVDLNGDGRNEAVVWARDNSNCGTGGCDLAIFVHARSGWRLFSTVATTRPPIELLGTRNHGWHDIGVWNSGGGIRHPYEGRVHFNGRKYPFSGGAEKLPRGAHGRVIIKDATIPLFPSKCRKTVEAPSLFGPLPIKSPKPGSC